MAKQKRSDVRRDNDKRPVPRDEPTDSERRNAVKPLEPPSEPVDLRSGFPLLVRMSDYLHTAYPKSIRKLHGELVSAKVLPTPPDNWPPPAWESDVTPVDGSLDAIRQWIDCMIKSLAYVEDSQQRGGWSEEAIRDSGSDTVRDAYRLVEHLYEQGWGNAPQKPQGMFNADAAIMALREVREWLARGDGAAKAAAEAKAMETSRVTAGAAGEAATEAGVGGGEDPPPKPLSLEEMMKLLVTEAGGDEGLGPDRTSATAPWYVSEMKTRWSREYHDTTVRKTNVWTKIIIPARRDAKRKKQTEVSLQEGKLPPDRHHEPRHWGEYDDNNDD